LFYFVGYVFLHSKISDMFGTILRITRIVLLWIFHWLRRRKIWQWKAAAFAVVAVLVIRNDLNLQISMQGLSFGEVLPAAWYQVEETTSIQSYSQPMNVSLIPDAPDETPQPLPTKVKSTPPPESESKPPDNVANTYSNMSFKGKIATDDDAARRAAKRKKQLAYVKRFKKVAQAEMEKFGIPASITLAQGLIESNCGESRLATSNNNHFGIKCFSRKCRKGHCSNFTDDSHKDFFRKYKSAWESYRSHSYLLQADRYKPLKKLAKTDYEGWAKGLKKAGYATDKHYAEKLIQLIEDLDLHQYDK